LVTDKRACRLNIKTADPAYTGNDQKFITGLVYWAGPTSHQTGSCGWSKQKGTLIPQLAAPQENGLSMLEKML